MAARAAWWTAMRNLGVASANQIADKEDMERVNGGDVRLFQQGFAPLEFAKDLAQAQINNGNGSN